MAKERFDEKQIWLVLFHHITRRPFIGCQSADRVAPVMPDNGGESFSGDRTVVSNSYRRLSRGERCGEGPHKFVRVTKNCSADKQNSLTASYSSVTATVRKFAASFHAGFFRCLHHENRARSVCE